MISDDLATLETQMPGLLVLDSELTITEAFVRQAWPYQRAEYAAPAGLASADPIVPVANHGRWLVSCPYCDGAQYASEKDPRFFCVDCLHAGQDSEGEWIAVAWPTDRAGVQEALAERPAENQNWDETQAISDLVDENTAHDIKEAD